MKKLILSVTAVVGFSIGSFAQGIQFADSASPAFDTTISGIANTSQDLNLQLLEGSTSSTATTVLATLLLNNTSANGDISVFGFIYDNSGTVYSAPAGTDYFQVLAWTGNYSSYAAASGSGQVGVYAGSSPVFSEAVPAPPATPPALTGLGTINLTQVSTVPEPSTLAMTGVGLASMLFFRRKNK
jgi:hypothetical protein